MEKSKIKIPEGFHDLGEEVKLTAIDLSSNSKEESDSYHYPCLYFSSKDSLKDFPENGTATIHYKKVMEREETVTRDGEKKKNYTVELQIHGIKAGEATESEAVEADEPSDEDAIEKGLEAASDSTKS